jgi:hypothetical protein
VVVISLIGQTGEAAMNGATEEEKAAEEKRKKEGPFSIEEVLAAEAKEIHGDNPITQKLTGGAKDQDAQEKRKKLNEDQRGRTDRDDPDVQARSEFYIGLNELNSAALCCSGGGIRSATFCLGVIQALAGCDVGKEPPARSGAAPAKHEIKPSVVLENSALGRLHYLSTVSGGGYVGSWLSSWRHRCDFKTVIENLTGRPNGPDIEPPEISWLRAYSNYLTPQLGIASADSWAAVAISVRNLVLNWLVIIPVVCLVLLTLKLIATVSVWVAHGGDDKKCWVIAILAAGIASLIVAQAYTTRHRPSRRVGGSKAKEVPFLWLDLLWAVLSAIAVTIFFSSHYFSSLLDATCAGFGALEWPKLSAKFTLPVAAAAAAFVVYALGWIVGYVVGWIKRSPLKKNQGGSDFIRWAASGLVYGAIVGFGAYLYLQLKPYSNPAAPSVCALSPHYAHLLLPIILGVPWVLMAQLAAEIVFVGLTSYEDDSDSDREWLGRAAGWLAACAVAWALIAFLVFAGGFLVENAVALGHETLVKAGGVAGVVSGIITALLGGSSKTPAKSTHADQGGWTATAYNIVLALAGPIFVAILIIVLSVGLDKLLAGDALVRVLQDVSAGAACTPALCGNAAALTSIAAWFVIGLVILVVVEWLASYFVNINRFSLHALYRNRLIRCYLGASNEERDPDLFSGFDFKDNVCVHQLWPPKPGEGINPYSLFHVVNIALNIVSTKRLAWQERKAESFTVSPQHCGGAYLGFRHSKEYGGDDGLSLGTAMAISGAAVSPNMGYHSSPSLALLLTLFNVRLGWWLGNPGPAGDKDIRPGASLYSWLRSWFRHPAPVDNKDKAYRSEGPQWAVAPLLFEAFGQTTDERSYVYLSDGGHFENLGLYEMVRRRCRLIIVVDAGCDSDFAFEDLGNAVRKIYIDLGIRITFEGLERLQNHPSPHPLSGAVLDAAARVNREVAKVAKAAAQAARALANAGEADARDHETTEADGIPYHAIGTIHYEAADRGPDDHGAKVKNGYILYIKPAYHGTETSAGIRSYATANPDFPHESTADQWFTESQLESYRSLGLEIADDILGRRIVLNAESGLTLHKALSELVVHIPSEP